MGSKPLIILHAKGDERIPSDFSEEVAARKPEPKKLIVLPGGHHRSIQHDQEMQSVALGWLAARLRVDARRCAQLPPRTPPLSVPLTLSPRLPAPTSVADVVERAADDVVDRLA